MNHVEPVHVNNCGINAQRTPGSGSDIDKTKKTFDYYFLLLLLLLLLKKTIYLKH